MESIPGITVYTQTYNAGIYLRECIESVLNQTYDNFEYIIIDHGSVDDTWNTIKKYSNKDNRIRAYKYDHNAKWLITKLRTEFKGKYYTVLDQDDWIEESYLERLLGVAEKTNADIVNTGSVFFNNNTPCIGVNALDEQLLIDKEEYNKHFTTYHWFYRQYWGKLIKTELLQNAVFPNSDDLKLSYGIDTYTSFTLLRLSKRICIDNSSLHHYRVHGESVSNRYTINRSYSDLVLYNYAIDFLSDFGTISLTNKLFLYSVYLHAVNDTIGILSNSDLSEREKFEELIRILKRNVTKEVLFFSKIQITNMPDSTEKYFFIDLCDLSLKLADAIFESVFEMNLNHICEYSEIESIISDYLGDYIEVITDKLILFWVENKELRLLLISNRKSELICEIANMIYRNICIQKYDIERLLNQLTQKDSILSTISNKMFIKRYYEVYLLVVKKEYLNALEHMNEIISNNDSKLSEVFFNLYLILAALLEKKDEFLNGKLYIAQLYFQHNRFEECKAVIKELEEMGFEKDENIINLKICIDNKPKVNGAGE